MGLNLAQIQKDNYDKYVKEVENSYTNVNGLKISKIPSQSSNKSLFNKPTSNNIAANVLGTVADIASQAGAGLGSFFETPVDLAANVISGGLKLIGADDSAEKVRNFANMDISGNIFGRNDEVMQQQAKDYSYLGDYGKDIAYTVGNVGAMAAGSQALSAIGGTANLGNVSANAANVAVNIGKHTLNLPTFAMAAGLNAGFKEADEKGANEAQRWAKALTSGLSEGISEGLFGFLGVGGNDITDTLTKTLVNKVPSTVGKVFTRLGINAVGEGAEEVVSYLGEWMADNAIVDKLGDADFKKKWDNGEVLEQFALAAASTLLTGGFDVKMTTNNAIESAEQQLGRKLTNAEKIKVTQAALSGTEANVQPQQTNMTQIQNPSVEDIVEKKPVEKITVQDLVNQEKNGNNTVNLPQAKYQFTMGSNDRLNALHESMAKYFNNSIETQELAKTIDKIIEDKNYNVTFDNSIVNVNGQPVNAQITTGTNGEVNIKINPNSPRAAEFLMIHEITHAIETNTMKDLVLDYANKNAEFRTALEDLKRTYGTNDVSSEVLADISGQLFGNQEFINSLSIEKPNIFRRIYNAIISLANKITGNSNQALFIQDLKNKWQEAYRTQQNNLKETRNSIQNIEENNIIATSKVDNLGRTLTKEQQEFFKDSKARDENGNLQVMYHTTPAEFTIFDKSKLGDNTGYYNTAFGFFVTPNKEFSNRFGDIDNNGKKAKTMELYINAEKPIIHPYNADYMYSGVELDNIVDKYFKAIGETEALEELKSYVEDGDYESLYSAYRNTVLTSDVDPFEYSADERKVLKKKGYDSVIFVEGNENNTIDESKGTEPVISYAVFNANQIKNVDNTNPTANEDIRYSKNSSEWQDYLERNYQATGTRTNMQDIKKGRRKRTKIESKETPKLPEKSVKLLSNNMKKTLGLNKNQAEDLMNQINEFYGNVDNVTRQEIYEYLDRNFSIQKVQETIQDVKEIQTFLRNYKLKVSDSIKSDIANYGDLRQRNFGKIRFSNDGSSVDTAYQELNKLYPEYFPEDIVNPTDQLLQIIDVANLENKQINETEIPENFIKEQAKYIYESLQDYELKQRQDYIESYGKEAFDIAYPKKKSRKTVREQLLDQMGITANDLSMGNDIKAINYQITDPIRVNEKVFGKELGQKINDATINQTKHNTAEKTRWLNEQRDEIKALGIKARSKESAAVQKLAEKQYVDSNGTLLPYDEATLALEFPDVETQNKIKKAAEILRGKYDTYLDQLNGVLVDMGYDPIPKRKDYMRHFQELTDIFSTIGTPFNLKDMTANELPTDINGLTEQFKPGKNWFASAKPRLGLKTNYDAITGIDQYIEGAGNIIYHTADIQRYRALANMIRDTFGQTKGMENLEGLTEEEMQQRIKDIQDNKLNKYVAWLDEQANALAGKKGAIDRGTERALGRKAYSIMNTIKKQVGSNMTGFNVASSLTNFISTTIAAGKTNKIALAKGIVSTINNMFHNDGFVNKSDFLTSRFGSDSLSQRWWNKASNAGQIFMTASDNITSNIITRSKYFEGLQKGMTEKQAIKYADDFAARVMGDRAQGSTAEIFNSKTLGLLTQFQLEVNNQWQYMVHDTRMDFKENATNKGKINAGATMVWQLGQIAGLSYLFNEVFQKIAGRRAAFDPIDILKKLFGLDDDDEEKDMNTRIQEALDELIDNIPFASVLTGGRIPIGEALPIKELITGKDDYGNDKARMETLKETLPYYILPTGYGQLKKMEAGAKMYDTNLPVAGSYTKAGNLRFTADTSTAGKIKNVLFGQWSSKEAQDYLESGSSTITPQRIEEMKDLGMNSTQYRKYRKGLAEASTNDAKIDYIMGLNVDNTKKNIMANNVLQSSKYKFDAGEYKDFGSLDEYKEYKTNPEKYAAITQITDYNTYQGYKNNIKTIKDNTSNDKQETIEYINSLPLNVPQKAMFIRMYYPSYNNYNRQIIEYINNQDLTVEQKTNILRGNGFTVEDGRVY